MSETKKKTATTKRVTPYAKKENQKKTEAKNKLKGSIVIDPLPMNNPVFMAVSVSGLYLLKTTQNHHS